MNSPVRPSAYFTGGTVASAASGMLATVPNPPPEIARLPAGTTLRGVVLGEDGKGHTLIQTALGTLSVTTRAHLAKDSEVVLQLRSSGVQLHILVMQTRSQNAPSAQSAQSAQSAPLPPQPPATLQGEPAAPGGGRQPAVVQPGAPGQAPAVPLPMPPGGQTDLLTLGQTVKAVLQAPAAGLPGAQGNPGPAGAPTGIPTGAPTGVQIGALAAGLPEALAGLSSGAVLKLRILSVKVPGAAPGPPGSPAPAGGPGTSLTGPPTGTGPAGALPGARAEIAGVSTGGASPGPAPGMAPGVTSGTAAGPAGAPAGPAAAIQSAPPTPLGFNGQITGVTHAGYPVVSSPLGTLVLEVQARLPNGSILALEVSPSGLAQVAEASARPSMPMSLGHAWPALQEALALLSEPAAGAGAAQSVPAGVPQPGPRLASSMLFFLAALSGGDIGRWLGAEALRTLGALGRDSLIGRLSRDLAQMGRMADGAGGAGSDWRLLPIPLWDGDQVRQLRLFLRQHDKRRDEGGKRGRPDATRFILELEMSRMGEMQLDGLVRDKRFDLVMRTRAALPDTMKRDIRHIFEDANQAAGYSGNLGFQAVADWHFLPYEPPREAGGLVV